MLQYVQTTDPMISDTSQIISIAITPTLIYFLRIPCQMNISGHPGRTEEAGYQQCGGTAAWREDRQDIT